MTDTVPNFDEDKLAKLRARADEEGDEDFNIGRGLGQSYALRGSPRTNRRLANLAANFGSSDFAMVNSEARAGMVIDILTKHDDMGERDIAELFEEDDLGDVPPDMLIGFAHGIGDVHNKM